MRINKYVASASGLSRRAADAAIQAGRILVNGQAPSTGQDVTAQDTVTLDGKVITAAQQHRTVLFNKPVGFVVSRDGQGSRTIYDLLPPELHPLNPVGRLDKNSSGLLVLTTDGQLAQSLTHPSSRKQKVYEIRLTHALQPLHRQMISEMGVQLADGPSRLVLERLADGDDTRWRVRMHEGRNRQIRRTFQALGYEVTALHRTDFGPYTLGRLKSGAWQDA